MHLLPYTSILLTASAAYLPPRALDPCLQDVQDYEAVQLDGITADGTAGIGAEFESPAFYFTNPRCSIDDTNAAKKQIVAGRTGTNWELTADSTSDAGKVNAEYILDGTKIKVGSGDGATAGKAWADDLTTWTPWSGTPPNLINIANSNCNPWTIATPPNTDVKNLPFAPQITAPMPLEALYKLMTENEADPQDKNILDGTNFRSDKSLVVVQQAYFQSNPNGLDQSKISNDVLAFCSLVLSYAKAATNILRGDQSPKFFLEFMPRTEFITLFGIVKSKLTGDLFQLFDNLACYKTVNGNVQVDNVFCTGPVTAPVSNGKLGGLSFSNPAKSPSVSVNIKDWISGIGSGTAIGNPPVDALSDFDRSIDTSIGGLDVKMEKMYNSQRSVPLFEFRNLDIIYTPGVEQFMKDVDSAIQTLHGDFANPLTKMKRDGPASCARPFAAAGASGSGGGGGGSPDTKLAGLKCTMGANGNNKFLARDELNNQIGTFCGVAAQQGVQDHNSGSIVRTYNQGQRYQVSLSMDWPSGQDITQNMKQNCIDGMNLIMDSCDGNDPKNPLDWKHGGTNGVGNILYHVVPSTDQGYTPGNCTFHLQEDESWSGVNSPGFERHWDFHLEKLTLDDGAGATIGTSPPGSPIDAGAGNAFSWNTKLPNPLVMTPEAQGNPADYIQFIIGTESWQSSQNDNTKMPFCNVGGFNSDYSPDNRNMDCWFNC